MTEKQLSTRKKTNEANATSNINPSTATKKRKKSSPNTTPTTTTIADNNDSNNNIAVLLPTINSESLPLTPAHTQPLIGADILSIPRIGTKAVAALLAYIGSTTGRRIVEELLVEVTVRPYATGTTIGKLQQQVNVIDMNDSSNSELRNIMHGDNNSVNNNDNNDDGTNEVVLDTIITTTDIDFIITATPSPTNSTNDGDNSISTSTGTSSTKSKSRSSNVNRSIVNKSYLPLLNEVVVFTGKFTSMTRSGAGAVSEKLGTR